MKLSAILFTILSLSVSAPAAPKKKVPAKPAGPTAQILTIPAGATQNADGTFAYTDKDGKRWLYAKTPFGIMRSVADTSGSTEPTTASAATLQFTKAVDTGDTVKFERATPFGPVKWEKKKADLTLEEKSILDHQTAKTQ